MGPNDPDVGNVIQFIRQNISLGGKPLGDEYYYAHFPLCVIDAVFSLGIKYPMVQSLVRNYCAHQRLRPFRPRTGALPPTGEQHTISAALAVASSLTVEAYAEQVFKNRCRTSPTGGILKADAVQQVFQILQRHGIEHLQDAHKLYEIPQVEQKFREVRGQGSGKSWRYLLMLAGDESLIKPDRMIQRFLLTATGKTPDMREAQQILEAASAVLKAEHPGLTPRLLDYKIWEWQRAQT
jgi:hypothetical protein